MGEILRQRRISTLTMQGIADHLGVTKGNLYYYFKNKEEMLFECHVKATEDSLRLLDEARSLDGSPGAQLSRLISGLVRSVMQDPYGAILVTDLESLAPDQRGRYVALRDRFEHGVRALIRQGIECGEFAPADEKISGFAVLGSINWISRWYDPAGPRSPDEIAETFATLLVRGLRP